MISGMKALPNPPSVAEISSSALWFLVFVVFYSILAVASPPSVAQLRVADPLHQWLLPYSGLWMVTVVSFFVTAFWIGCYPPSSSEVLSALRYFLAGSAVGLAFVGLLRVAVGPHFPAFIPPEESSAPGLTLGLGAGVLEEAAFRLLILPAVYFGMRKFIRRAPAILVSSLATGLLFAASHQLGPGAGVWVPRYFLTRAIFPGFFMSVVFWEISPAFIVAAHCAAHFGIYWWFAS